MQTQIDDTIVAIASAPGPAARGIVRISGPDSWKCLSPLFKSFNGTQLNEVTSPARLEGEIKLVADQTIETSLLWWPTKKSYTRQPCGELHMVGSMPVLDLLLEKLSENGARLAEPGEFTMRAFLSGRIDLTQAEAVLAVIDSESQNELSTALQQLAGGIGGPISQIRSDLLDLLAELEAGLDFVEEDIEFISPADVLRRLEAAGDLIKKTLNQITDRATVDHRLKVVLLGRPNAGKSSLFNALLGTAADGVDSAIVSDVAGTTRDFLTADLDWNGHTIRLCDTAGLGLNDATTIDLRAARLAEAEIENADIRLVCVPAGGAISQLETEWLALENCLIVRTKTDLPQSENSFGSESFAGQVIHTSSTQRKGLGQLKQAICNLAGIIQNTGTGGTTPAISRASDSLACALESLDRATKASKGRLGEEVIASEIRSSLEQLGRVVGTIYTDDILDLVFGRFCIGK